MLTEQKQVSKDDPLWIEILSERLDVIDGNERRFAESIIQFWGYQGRLSEKQRNGARKLCVRLICREK